MTHRPAVVLATICITLAGHCAKATCLDSAQAVWAEHPGSHAKWRYTPDHTKCWRAGHPLSGHGQLHRRGSFGMAAPVPTIPLPKRRPDPELHHPALYERLAPVDGRALMLELLGE